MADGVFYDGPPTGIYELDRFREVMEQKFPNIPIRANQDRNNSPPLWRSLDFYVQASEAHVRYFIQGVNGTSKVMVWAEGQNKGAVKDLVSTIKELE